MSTFKYGDEKITDREIMIAVPSMVIAVGIITFPRNLAETTIAADGWLAILISGLIAVLLVWTVTKIAASFPQQPFLTYASKLVTRPLAIVFTFLFIVQGILLTAFEVRAITDISHQFLFRQTPVEIVALCFLLVVVYAVSGSRASLFRLNAMFFPIIGGTTAILILFSIGYMDGKNVLPMLKTDFQGYFQGITKSTLSFTGIGILFFYISLVKNPKKAPSKASLGMLLAVLIYLLIFVTCITVFGDTGTANIRFPLIELSKSIEIPGGFFERLESIFFVIWIMAIFTTTAMAFDVAVFAISSLYPKAKKLKIIFLLSPIIFLISTFPQNYLEIDTFANFVSYFGWGLTTSVTVVLWIMYLVKGGKKGVK